LEDADSGYCGNKARARNGGKGARQVLA